MFLSSPSENFALPWKKSQDTHKVLSFLIGSLVTATSRSVAEGGAIGYLHPQSKIAKHKIEFSFQTLFPNADKNNF
jgi:hypothetical protein